jgi:O-antigen ligase/polysaccharide polymerase Wzy-like membrane protein/tetratricopeptide repeat protein
VSSHAAPVDPRSFARRISLPRVGAAPLATIGFGAVIAAVALEGAGGLQLGPLTTVEIGLEILAGIAGCAAMLVAPARRIHGGLALAAFGVLVVFTAMSIIWAVDPDDAWIEVNRTLAWFAAFALGLVLARVAPHRWDSLLGGVVLGAVIVSGYAVLTKVFPGALNPGEVYARLREPFGYWNSVGILAAMAVPACLWLAARRSGHAALNALAYPALALLVVASLLAYSRGSLLAMAIGCAFWFASVPLRLRATAVLATAGLTGLLVGLWAFGQDALSQDRVPLALRTAAGHDLGVLVVTMLIVMLIVGLAVNFSLAQSAPAPTARRGVGLAALVCLALVPVAVAGMLATSSRGLTGSISNGFNDLTNPNASVPANDPTRLTAIGSVRARYWDEALRIWRAHEALGVGAGGYRTARLRIRQDTLNVRHAHGYVVQTLADLGLVGLAISLALLAAWLAAAARTTGFVPKHARRAPFTPERVAMLSLVAIVVVFGVHSFVDWTWIVPGNAVPAMLCAGWVAGRGPLVDPLEPRPELRESLRALRAAPWRVAGALAIAALTAVAVWTTWQPQRSVDGTDAALEAVEANKIPVARADVRTARARDPLSTTPLYVGATVEQAAGNLAGARRLYSEAVHMQPSSGETWLRLAQFELGQGDSAAALRALGPALYLDPRSPTVIQAWLDASRQETARQAAAAKKRSEKRKKKRGG